MTENLHWHPQPSLGFTLSGMRKYQGSSSSVDENTLLMSEKNGQITSSWYEGNREPSNDSLQTSDAVEHLWNTTHLTLKHMGYSNRRPHWRSHLLAKLCTSVASTVTRSQFGSASLGCAWKENLDEQFKFADLKYANLWFTWNKYLKHTWNTWYTLNTWYFNW